MKRAKKKDIRKQETISESHVFILKQRIYTTKDVRNKYYSKKIGTWKQNNKKGADNRERNNKQINR